MRISLRLLLLTIAMCPALGAQVAVIGDTVYTMKGEPIRDGVVLIQGKTIKAVGPLASTELPAGTPIVWAKVVLPGLIDAHTVIGLTGYLNQPHDQEQVETSAAIQPELRASDAYNPEDRLVEWVRGLGVTTIHTGHGPLALVSGQTMVVKTVGRTVEDAVLKPRAMIAATLAETGRRGRARGEAASDKGPGTRAKAVALLREELVRAAAYAAKTAGADESKRPERNLKLEALAEVLAGKTPLLVTCQRHQDIAAAIRLAKEFKIRLVLDGAADGPDMLEEIKASGFPVIVHPAMQRPGGESENLRYTAAASFVAAGIPTYLQSGFESYVPKTRVVLFEAAVAVANGLGRDQALRRLTIDAAKFLEIDDRVGSLEVGKDADLALYDGDPFEYLTHCIGVFIDGKRVAEGKR